MTARFQRQRVGKVLRECFVFKDAVEHGFSFAALQTLEGRDENLGGGFCGTHGEELSLKIPPLTSPIENGKQYAANFLALFLPLR